MFMESTGATVCHCRFYRSCSRPLLAHGCRRSVMRLTGSLPDVLRTIFLSEAYQKVRCSLLLGGIASRICASARNKISVLRREAARQPQRVHPMKRRDFITFLGGAVIVTPLAVRAQQPIIRIPHIGIIDDAPIWDHFRQGLRDLGYIEGQNKSSTIVPRRAISIDCGRPRTNLPRCR